ncbi:hypothetical protein SK128_027145 [Halocaridina rubra]|uniref:Uncharacterized protein n=1 Tax=Halocaridina rubra TaxID=373956 RepID=A0AAN9A6J8_HALRR
MKGPPKNASLAFRPAISNYSWVTLAVLLQDSNIVIYRTEDRENALVSQASLGSKVTATVSASDIQYVVFNCPAGCLMHDSTSPLIGRQLSIPVDGIALYIKQEEEAQNAFLQLGFTDVKGNLTTLKIDVTKHGASLWHKLTIVHNKEDHVNVTVFVDGKGKEVGKAYMMEDLLTVTILNSSSVLWSLHCYPENPTGQGGWNIDISRNASIAPEGKKAGAGIGEVLAWVLAAIALFIVMIMALLLCTKMGPREDTLGYGASVGVVTSFGKMVMQNEADREAEEDTEPDSPTLMMAPVVNINHRTPEEVDEDQVNSKEL